jgi:hypothetical protein
VEGKLFLLRAILDAGWIEKSEAVKLQCLGVALATLRRRNSEWSG